MTESSIYVAVVDRRELAKALRGELPPNLVPFSAGRILPRLSPKDSLVAWRRDDVKPCLICVPQDDRDEFYNWVFSFQRDLSPISSWCHVVSLREFEKFTTDDRLSAGLSGLDAAWAGAILAEAMALSRRDFDAVSLSACLATDTFAVARMAAIYGARSAAADAQEMMDKIRDRFKRLPERWRPASGFPVSVLLRMMDDPPPVASKMQDVFLNCCKGILDGAADDRGTTATAVRPLADMFPRLSVLRELDELPAERRVRLLREVADWVTSSRDDEERQAIAFGAGFIISRIGGAELDLRLAENFGPQLYPLVLSWAAILGGLGAKTYWSDAFSGVGRLLTRELRRSVYPLDSPSSDISAEELLVVSGGGSIPRIRTALNQAVAVSLRPGISVHFAPFDGDRASRGDLVGRQPERRPQNVVSASIGTDSVQLERLAEQLFPFMRRLFERLAADPSLANDKRSAKRSRSSPELPLKD